VCVWEKNIDKKSSVIKAAIQITPNIARKSGSLNLKGMLETWRRFGWLLASVVVVEEELVVTVDVPFVEGDVEIIEFAWDIIVCTPDDDEEAGDDNLASALALDTAISASELSSGVNSFNCCCWSLLLLAVVDTDRGNDVLHGDVVVVIIGCETIELKSVVVEVCKQVNGISWIIDVVVVVVVEECTTYMCWTNIWLRLTAASVSLERW